MSQIGRQTLFLASAALVTADPCLAGDVVKMHLTPAVREYCHVLRFPSGWQMPKVVREDDGSQYVPPNYSLAHDYEIRIHGFLGTRFLVRGVVEVGEKYYTSNLYEVDLSDPQAPVRPGTDEEWISATVITAPRNVSSNETHMPNRSSNYFEYRGLRFTRTGDEWWGATLSPDRALWAVQSWSGKLAPSAGSDVPGDVLTGLTFGRSHGRLFFDLYSVDDAKKLITPTATFSGIFPEEVFRKTIWVTERYFLIPLDERRNQCLVCDFGPALQAHRASQP